MSEKIKNNRPKGKVIVAEKSKDFKNSFKRLIFRFLPIPAISSSEEADIPLLRSFLW